MLPSRVVVLIDELEAAGLVERTRDGTDRRRNALALTTAGTVGPAHHRRGGERARRRDVSRAQRAGSNHPHGPAHPDRCRSGAHARGASGLSHARPPARAVDLRGPVGDRRPGVDAGNDPRGARGATSRSIGVGRTPSTAAARRVGVSGGEAGRGDAVAAQVAEPARLATTTGVPAATASSATRPNGSYSDGTTATSAAAEQRHSLVPGTKPSQSTAPATRRRRACSRSSSSYGPVPATASRNPGWRRRNGRTVRRAASAHPSRARAGRRTRAAVRHPRAHARLLRVRAGTRQRGSVDPVGHDVRQCTGRGRTAGRPRRAAWRSR